MTSAKGPEDAGPKLTSRPSSRSILILYGSETGNSQEIAEDLDRIVQRLRFKSTVAEMNSVQLSALLQYSLVVFVIPTTGQGDFPRNAVALWKRLLRRKLAPGCLGAVNFTTFGHGDTSYPRFNWAARKLVRRLQQLGAAEIYPSGEADERHPDGLEGLYLLWSIKFREFLLTTYPMPDGLEPLSEDEPLPPRFSLHFKPGDGVSKTEAGEPADLERSLPIPEGITATLVSNERITAPEHFQDVRLLKLDVPLEENGSEIELNPGDTITMYPNNTPEDAQSIINWMGWSNVADVPIDWSNSERPPNLFADESFTLRHLLIHNLDITAVPRRSFLRNISYFSTDPYQKERLLEFTAPEYLDDYYDYTTRPRRTILEILHEFDSVKVPPERALDTFPVIRGREFSIANGGEKLRHPTDPLTLQRVEIVAALVRYRTILRKEREGLCSRYVVGLGPGARFPVMHKKALTPYHGPAIDKRPLVGVATGTGVAPVRSLLWHRASVAQQQQQQQGQQHPASSSPPPAAHLFFGFRAAGSDFHFKDEWPTLPFLTVHAAQSRPVAPPAPPSGDDGDSGGTSAGGKPRREYVQDLIRKESGLVADMVRRGAIFLVCGGSHKMAQAAKEAVLDAIGGEDEDRQRIFDELDWIQEVW